MLKSKIFILMILFALLGAACTPMIGTPAPIVTEEPLVVGIAVVQSVEIQILESSPIQVNAIARGQLPDAGCTTISSVNQVRDGNTIRVTLSTTTDPLALCAQAHTPFEQVIALDLSNLPPARYMVNVNGIEQSFVLLTRDVSQFKQVLVDGLNARNYDLLRVLMDESLVIAHWQSEGQSYAPELAVEQLRMSLLNSSSAINADPNKDLAALLGMDPVTLAGPEVIEASPLFASGWGSEGKDESILFVARRPDGGLYWYGLLFAKDGFTKAVPNTGSNPDTNVYTTDVQYIMAQENVLIRNGPGTDFGVVGRVFSGQTVRITGTNASGSWWRVACPDGSVGGCWVSADSSLTRPTTPPQTGQPVPDAGVIPTISILAVVRHSHVIIRTHNYPANTDFKVRMGESGTKGIDGIVVENFNSGNGGTLTLTFDIPEQLYGEKQIAIRLESKNGYYSYNWFDNATFGNAPSPTDPQPTNVKYITALKDIEVYSGPSKNFRVIGTFEKGETVQVTALSVDGYWWRVVCPDGKTGVCWVSAKSKFTRPSG